MPKFILSLFLFWGITYADTDSETSDVEKDPVHKADRMAEKYEISPDSVNYLKDHFKIGYGGVGHALQMAQNSDKTTEEILAMKTEGKMGWGQISRELGLKPGKNWESRVEAAEAKQNRGQATKAAKMEAKAARKLEQAERKQNRGK